MWHVFCSHIVPSYSQYKPKPMYEGNLFSNSLSAILRSYKIEKLLSSKLTGIQILSSDHI